jgi:hypothetical protein
MELKTTRFIQAGIVALSLFVIGVFGNCSYKAKLAEYRSEFSTPTAGIISTMYKVGGKKKLTMSTNDISFIVGLGNTIDGALDVTSVDDIEDYNAFADSVLNVRALPNTDSEVLGKINGGDIITVVGQYNDEWVTIDYNDQQAFIAKEFIHEMTPEEETYNWSWTGAKLNRGCGTVYGPSGKETYYNLDMSRCVYYMNTLGYYYPVWIRSDGVRMFGNFVMCAADLNKYPKGSLVETSLGTGIVVDTGAFVVNGSGVSLDIAVTW